MSTLTQFQFESNDIRFVEVNGSPYVVATDILKASESTLPVTRLESMIVEGLGDGFTSNQPIIDSLGRQQTVLVLSEPAFTFYLSRSRTEAGKKLNRWIHTEVLPSIRKTGSYTIAEDPKPTRQLPEKFEVASLIFKANESTLPASVKQILIDSLTNEYLTELKILPESKDRWLGVAQRAEELGYKPTASIRSTLGKYAKKQGLNQKQEDRLVNGQMRSINVYLLTEALDQVIHDYFSLNRLAIAS